MTEDRFLRLVGSRTDIGNFSRQQPEGGAPQHKSKEAKAG